MKEKLTNGITIAYYDESKKIAADRWLVKLRCHASTPLKEWMAKALIGDDDQTTFCRELFDGQLTYQATMERNFIDEGEKNTVMKQLRNDFDDNATKYLAKELFLHQLFVKRKAEYEKRYLLQSKSSLRSADGGEDPPEPVDFSACFL